MTIETEEDLESCHICFSEVPSSTLLHTFDGYQTCTNCGSTCAGCGQIARANRMRTMDEEDTDDQYCTNCARTCPECSWTGPRDEMYRLGGSYWCDDHYHSGCEDCGESYAGQYNDGVCASCESDSRSSGVIGYQHTRATQWLGGPVKKRGGYYLGVELEISASRPFRANCIHEWGIENFPGTNGSPFECKEDSSVEGFEIVTQPMTPAYFESIDWDGFFKMLNENFPLRGEESTEHGLHVHVGRIAFRDEDGKDDPVGIAGFSYLLSTGNHLERIARREPYHYCAKVERPVSTAILSTKGYYGKQGERINRRGVRVGRDAVNLTNGDTIEIRAYRSTRSANEFRNAVRSTYLAAEYIRHLRERGPLVSKDLNWTMFSAWVGANFKFAYPSIANMETSTHSNRANDSEVVALDVRSREPEPPKVKVRRQVEATVATVSRKGSLRDYLRRESEEDARRAQAARRATQRATSSGEGVPDFPPGASMSPSPSPGATVSGGQPPETLAEARRRFVATYAHEYSEMGCPWVCGNQFARILGEVRQERWSETVTAAAERMESMAHQVSTLSDALTDPMRALPLRLLATERPRDRRGRFISREQAAAREGLPYWERELLGDPPAPFDEIGLVDAADDFTF